MSFFNTIPELKEDEIFHLQRSFIHDPRPNKVNLGIGVYKTADGKSLIMPAIRKAESLISTKYPHKDFSMIEGSSEFITRSLKLLFGTKSSLLESGRYFAAQTVGGTGALHLSGVLLNRLDCKSVFISQPSWSNHKPVFEEAGFNVESFPYFDSQTGMFDFIGMSTAIKNIPPKNAILLQASCHNPTGIDPSPEQWKELSALIKKQQLIPIFDIAYQGFGKGLDEDVDSLRLFVKEGHELIVCYSFAKNFGLYGERVGLIVIASSEKDNIPRIGSQIKRLIRTDYSNPPIHGARIVSILLESQDLMNEWKEDLNNIRSRIVETRRALVSSLYVEEANQDFSYIEKQCGLFSLLSLTNKQIQWLCQEKGVYMLNNGRLNIAGLNPQNIPYIAKAIASATKIT